MRTPDGGDVPVYCDRGHRVSVWGSPMYVSRDHRGPVKWWGSIFHCHCGATCRGRR